MFKNSRALTVAEPHKGGNWICNSEKGSLNHRLIGATAQNRTADLLITNQLLYR